MLIDLHPDSVDDITRANLKMLRDGFKEDLKREKPNVFHVNPAEDRKQLRKYVRAFDLIINYLGEK